jgi:hypothetical protein
MEQIKVFKLTRSFMEMGFEIFDGVLGTDYCSELAKKLREAINKDCLLVDNDGVHIRTKNGSDLIGELPEVKALHDAIHACMARSITNLLTLDDLPVAISANLLRQEQGHSFRYHFDRNEYTAVLYLTENEELPLCLYPKIRTDPLENEAIWLYQRESQTPVSVIPVPGRLVCFHARTCLHGVISRADAKSTGDRISLQFAYDTRVRQFEDQQYYGRATTVRAAAEAKE